MSLKDLLKEKRPAILQKWVLSILETYPADIRGFLEDQKDPFANPVGSAIREGAQGLYEGLLDQGERDMAFLDQILRIRAVQDLPPASALAFIPNLKKLIFDQISGEIQKRKLFQEWMELEARIDRMTLRAFDIYTACREKVHEIRIRELKEGSVKIWERIQSFYEGGVRQGTGKKAS